MVKHLQRLRKDYRKGAKATEEAKKTTISASFNALPARGGTGSSGKLSGSQNYTATPNTAPSNQHSTQSSVGSHSAYPRNNQVSNGTTMPRIRSQQLPHNENSRASLASSAYSSASQQPALPSYASYPASYTAQNGRGGTRSYSLYDLTYGEPLPEPDYPMSNDGTSNSNGDSGLESESRSSSGGKPGTFVKGGKSCQWRDSPGVHEFCRQHPNPRRANQGGRNSVDYLRKPTILRPRSSSSYGMRTEPLPNSLCNLAYHCRSDVSNGVTAFSGGRPPRMTREEEDWEEGFRYRSDQKYQNQFKRCNQEAPRSGNYYWGGLERVQLEDETTTGWRKPPMSERTQRCYRCQEDDGYTLRRGGLPRNQPIRGSYFHETDEGDRYGRPKPFTMPVGRTCNGRSFRDRAAARVEEDYDNEDDVGDDEDEDEEEDELSDSNDRTYHRYSSSTYATRNIYGAANGTMKL